MVRFALECSFLHFYLGETIRLHRREGSIREEGMEGGSGRQRNKEAVGIREMPKGKVWVDFHVSKCSVRCSSVCV